MGRGKNKKHARITGLNNRDPNYLNEMERLEIEDWAHDCDEREKKAAGKHLSQRPEVLKLMAKRPKR